MRRFDQPKQPQAGQVIVVFALGVVAVSILIDFLNAFIDPRVRY